MEASEAPRLRAKRRVIIDEAVIHDQTLRDSASAVLSPIQASVVESGSSGDDEVEIRCSQSNGVDIADLTRKLKVTQSFVMVPSVTSRKHSRANFARATASSPSFSGRVTSPTGADALLQSLLQESFSGSFSMAAMSDGADRGESLQRLASQLKIINPRRYLSIVAKLERKETSNRALIEAAIFQDMWLRCYSPMIHMLRLARLMEFVEKKLALLQRSQERWWREAIVGDEAVARCELDESFYRTNIVAERTHFVRESVQHIAGMRRFMAAHEFQKQLLGVERQEMRERRIMQRKQDAATQWLLVGDFLTVHRQLSIAMQGYLASVIMSMQLQVEEYVVRHQKVVSEECLSRMVLVVEFLVALWRLSAERELRRSRHFFETYEHRARASSVIVRCAAAFSDRKWLASRIRPHNVALAAKLLHRVVKGFFVRHFTFLKGQRNYFSKRV